MDGWMDGWMDGEDLILVFVDRSFCPPTLSESRWFLVSRRPSAQLARLSPLIFDNLTPDLTVSQPQTSLKTPRRRHKTAQGRLKKRKNT